MESLPKDALFLITKWFVFHKKSIYDMSESVSSGPKKGQQMSATTLLVLSKTLMTRFLKSVPSFQPWNNKARGLLFAARKGFVDYMLRWSRYATEQNLWNMGANDSEILQVAIRNRQMKAIQAILLDPHVDVNASGGYALSTAAAAGSVDMVEMILASCANVDPAIGNNYPVRVAAQYGALDVLKLLHADERVDIHAKDNDAARLAIERQRWNVVEWMHEQGILDELKRDKLVVLERDWCRGDKDAVKKLHDILGVLSTAEETKASSHKQKSASSLRKRFFKK